MNIRVEPVPTVKDKQQKNKQTYSYFEMLLRKEVRKLNANDELSANVDGVEIQGKRSIT